MGTSWRDLIKRWLSVDQYADYYHYDNVSSTADPAYWQIVQPQSGDNWNWPQGKLTTTGVQAAQAAQQWQQLTQWKGLWQQDQKEHDKILLEDIRAKANRYAALLLAEQGCV